MKPLKTTEPNTSKCHDCRAGDLIVKQGSYETVFNDGENETTLKVPGMTWLECESCGEVTLSDEAMDLIQEAKYEHLGLLSPAEIMTLRKKLGKNQEEMADLLGVGRKTYCRWENGTFFQTRANNKYLCWIIRLLDECPEAIRILEDLGAGISSKKRTTPARTPSYIRKLGSRSRGASKHERFDPNLAGHSHSRRQGRCCTF
jgi:putative zinc finger/helix-turn-helix YgiT family protein